MGGREISQGHRAPLLKKGLQNRTKSLGAAKPAASALFEEFVEGGHSQEVKAAMVDLKGGNASLRFLFGKMSDEKPSYKHTLFLPKTSFPMKASLVKNEPERLKKWENEGLYNSIQSKRREEGAEKFLLHDGPPFANGEVHMGTALNKVLKDFVVKSKSMAGYEVPFIPGWDCHGLPIEYKVMQDARDEEPAEIRRRCEEFARGWIDKQCESFRRLGVFGDWQNPYLTLTPSYEADILRTFGTLVEEGAVYQSLKPVQWSYGAKTALAEAEVDYQDKKSIAVYVPFKLADGSAIVIWTTTPWTLPANLGIAVHERFVYVRGEFSNGEETRQLIVARDLVESFGEATGWKPTGEVTELSGKELEGQEAQHPFLDRKAIIMTADFVTADSGTGAVHIAPGHGMDDYLLGQANGLQVLSPVDDDGKFTSEVGIEELVGVHVFTGNKRIVELLDEGGHLLGQETYEHSYPHCWRSKTPIIFRAVEQFFISLDGLRETALKEIEEVEWLPSWGRNRIYGTVESRPDWCVSRQRTWGVPLPVFFGKDGEVILDKNLIGQVADLVEERGSNLWFELSDEEWAQKLDLPEGTRRGRDTLDVWIDSGSSHTAVLEKREELAVPADLYLEATDQHRGWFQSSLLLGVGARGKAPYRTVLTHGFVVDKDTRKKTSKSDAKKKGKPTDAAHFYGRYGADVLRLWVSSVDWQNEVPFSEDLFQQVGEPYRRLRNSLRILLANGEQGEEPEELPLIDRWIMERLQKVIETCLEAYEKYDFRRIFSTLNHFCSQDLSALYIDITKDRLYCDAADSPRRQASTWVINEIFEALVKLLAPILAYTAEEAWEHSGREGSIHLEHFPEVNPKYATAEAEPVVQDLLAVKAKIQTKIEEAVQNGDFKKSNEAKVELTVPANHACLDLLKDSEFAKEFFIVAEIHVAEGPEFAARVSRTEYPMCPRCRRYEPPVNEEGLCARCAPLV